MLSKNLVTFINESILQNTHERPEIIQYENNVSNEAVNHLQNISYEEFFRDYMIMNKPCVISLKDVGLWQSSVYWVADGKPNLNFLEGEFGSSIVPVADCNEREYNSQKKRCMAFSDYIKYWKNLQTHKNSEMLYLKDWHFKREYPDYKAYETPVYFQSDWLNEFCENQEDDYQFVYMGPKGTWTPLHADVFGSYSWSVNICGRKKWLLFPPGHENFLKDERRQLRYMVDENYLDKQAIFHFRIIQEPGDVIFVPSGWYHQVWNMDDTISINHNWFNGCNIGYIWECLYQAAVDVENEIADIKEFEGWEDQWQIILKAHHGMNYADFLTILQFIMKSRIEKIELQKKTNLNWHFVYDLLAIKALCLKIINFDVPDAFADNINDLHLSIRDFLCNTVNLST